jgi:hypothetical protein
MSKEDNGMDIGRLSWSASAAYLYILRLDHISLAWEYLRRNSSYQADWRATAARWDSSTAGRWGLRYLEDPRRDARVAEPLWRPFPPSSVHLTRQSDAQPSARFQFWCIPGQKSLVHDGLGLQLTARNSPEVTRAVLDPDVGTDEPYAFSIAAGEHIQDRCRAVNEFSVSYGGQSFKPKNPPIRPSRSAMTHMRILQAFDGGRSGASQRDIAGAIFGNDAVSEQWSPDSELRAQVRYFLRRGHALVEAGYRTLLKLDSS